MQRFKHRHIRTSFYRQIDRQDCGVACLISVIKYFRMNADYATLNAISQAKGWGMTMLGLKRSAMQVGFTAQGFEMSPEDLQKQTSPVILHTLNSNDENHFIVYYSYSKITQKYLIGDPAVGVQEINSNELAKRWRSRTGLILRPGGSGVEFNRYGKWRWLMSLVHYEKFLLAFVTFLGLLTAGMGFSLAIYLQVLTDKILPAQDYKYMVTGLAMLAVLFIVRSFIVNYRQRIVITMVRDFNSNLVREFTRHLQKLPDYFLQSKTTGDMVVRFNDTQNIQFAFSTAVSLILIDMVMLITVTGFVFTYSFPVAISIITFIALTFALAYDNAEGLKRHQQRLVSDFSRTDNILISTVNELKENNTRSNLDLESKGFYDFVGSSEKFSSTVRKLSLKFEILGAVFFAGIIIYSSFLVIAGQYSKGQFLAIVTLISGIFPVVQRICTTGMILMDGVIALERVYAMVVASEKNELSQAALVNHQRTTRQENSNNSKHNTNLKLNHYEKN